MFIFYLTLYKKTNILIVYCLKEKYTLPDIKLLESNKNFDFFLWQPDRIYIVLGRSDNIESAINLAQAKKYQACILKRPSGGHTVILSPKTIVISSLIKRNKINGAQVSNIINNIILQALFDLNIKNVSKRGISDLAINDKKILGSSIYRPKLGQYFYHAVLNHSLDPQIINKLLLFPKRQPAYRKNRSHSEFITSLAKEGYNITIREIIWMLTQKFENYIQKIKNQEQKL